MVHYVREIIKCFAMVSLLIFSFKESKIAYTILRPKNFFQNDL